MMSVPQIIIDGEVVGGFMELVQADRRGTLRELAARAA
jgi:glutaredoxin-related protein